MTGFVPTSHEIRVLRMLNGETEELWGAWVGACLEFLSGAGFVSQHMPYAITEKGKAFLFALPAPS